MQFLIYGFQRSGTTLLRRIMGVHPDIKKVFHEELVLRRLDPKPIMLRIFLRSYGLNMKYDNWGEKVPYYNTAKNYSSIKYCKLWLDTFYKEGKIIHTIYGHCLLGGVEALIDFKSAKECLNLAIIIKKQDWFIKEKYIFVNDLIEES